MKKLPLFLCLTMAILLVFTNSCKKDQLVSFKFGNTVTQNAISQLSPDKLVKPEEVSNWVQQTFGSSIKPLWNQEMQSVVNGNHVVELPISSTTALFFTKVNGVLDVYGYKWMDRKPGAKVFTGGVSYFSFQTHIMQVSAYVDGKLKITKGFDLTPPSATRSSLPIIINSLNATNVSIPSAAPKKLADGGPADWIAMLACWISGGNWMGGYGANGCNFLDQGQSWIGSIFSSISNFIGGAIESIFGGGGGGGDDDNTSNNTNNSNSGDGFSYVGSDGTTITIDGSSIASGGMAYVTVNQPCTPGGPSDSGDGTTQTTQDSFSTDPNGCSGGGSVAQWVPVNIDPSSTDTDFNLGNYINLNNIDNDLNDVTILPNSTGNQSDDADGYNFNPSTDANFLDITFDQSFSSNTRLSTIYNKLSSSYTMQKVLSKFFGKKNPISLEFRSQNLSGDRADTYPIGNSNNPYTNRIIIIIDPDQNNTRPDLMIAKTIIHEVIHAEMYRILRLGKLGILPSDYNKILNAMLAYWKAYPLSNPVVTNKVWDHGYMAIHYLSTIAEGLKEYDNNPNAPLCFYKMLAWEGLNGTPFWNKLSSSDSQYISSAINNYISNQIITPCLN